MQMSASFSQATFNCVLGAEMFSIVWSMKAFRAEAGLKHPLRNVRRWRKATAPTRSRKMPRRSTGTALAAVMMIFN